MRPQGADLGPVARRGDGCRPGFQLCGPYRPCALKGQLLGLSVCICARRTEAWVGSEARGREQRYSPTLLADREAPVAPGPGKVVAQGPRS